MPTKIDWCDEVWNPVTGCSKISPGCDHCYAERMAKRLAGRYGYPKRNPFQVVVHLNRLDLPLRWKTPKRIFVNSMGDLFHDDVDQELISDVVHYMDISRKHTFLILTKRPENALRYFKNSRNNLCEYPHVWLGVTAENQEQADKRIPLLLAIPAEKHFVSVEPMLGPIKIRQRIGSLQDGLPQVDWVICGGETGPGARPMYPDWIRSIRDQCQGVGVPFFFKGWGAWWKDTHDSFSDNAGTLLDGREWREFPK